MNCPVLNVVNELAYGFSTNPRVTLTDGIQGEVDEEANAMFGTVEIRPDTRDRPV